MLFLLIDVENVKIGGTTYTIDSVFTPTLSISMIDDDGYFDGGESDGTVTSDCLRCRLELKLVITLLLAQ